MRYTADFETTTDVNDCRVWAFGVFQIGSEDGFEYGNSMDAFMQWCFSKRNPILYFHNLKFDGEFILNWLFRNGYKHTTARHPKKENEFTSLISDKGQFYSLEIGYSPDGKDVQIVKIYDSLKILPFAVEEVAKAFDLKLGKLKIDYHEKREIGHELTKEEVDYLRNDVEIVAIALHTLFQQKMNQITQGSNAMHDYKRITGKKIFSKWFPPPDYDRDVRQAYKGGWTYLNPKYADVDIGEGIVLDVNSLYPSRMYDELLPYGEGVFFSGRYKKDKNYPLYVQMFTCQFELREGYLPTIQLKNTLGFQPTEWLTTSGGEDVTLCLTNVDYELFRKHYKVTNQKFISGWKFQGAKGMFKEYIDKWMDIKIKATIEGNKGMRTLAKLMLNALYGKFALNPNVQSKIPFIDNGVIRYKLGEKEKREPIYVPMGAFITAYARNKTISAAQLCYDRFIYSDTDSLHLLGTELPEGLEIHNSKLGAWCHENTFTRARFVRQKTYIEEIDGDLHITCAGMPEKCYTGVTWDNFHPGLSIKKGKLKMVHCPGGIVLEDTPFTIKEA